jgi:hypothetical protein
VPEYSVLPALGHTFSCRLQKGGRGEVKENGYKEQMGDILILIIIIIKIITTTTTTKTSTKIIINYNSELYRLIVIIVNYD